jgi:uncharacterized protein (DUF433 family)
MNPTAQTVEATLNEVLNRLGRIENEMTLLRQALGDLATQPEHGPANGSQEFPVEGWSHLVLRSHPWRRQLSLQGRNLTVGQFLSTIRANQLTAEQASEAFDLPLAAVQEALAYGEQNRALIEWETAEERRRLVRKGYRLEPRSVPG